MRCPFCSHWTVQHALSCLLCKCVFAQWKGECIDWKSKPYHELTLWEKQNRKGARHEYTGTEPEAAL